MNDPLRACVTILELNTRLYRNLLAGLDEERARQSITPDSNNAAFVACHLLDARSYLCRLVTAGFENPYQKCFDAAKGPEDLESPPLRDLSPLFAEAGRALSARLHTLTPEELAVHTPERFPVDDPSLRGAIAFLLQHEALHLGQLSLLRRQLGYPAMSYD